MIIDAEVTVCGCTFVVDYIYYKGCPADSLNPSDPPEVDIISVGIKGQPYGEADELLEAIKIGLYCDHSDRIQYDNGYDIIQQKLLEAHQNEI